MIVQTQTTAQPFFPMADQAMPPAASPAAASETVTVTAPADTGDDGKSFFDNLLDVVNPLEHFPIVSTIYSHLTGDKPNDFTQVAGDTLYGGAIGLVSSIGNIAFTHITGKSVGDTVWGWVAGDDASANTATSAAKPVRHDDVRKPQRPSSDLFSFLQSNVGGESAEVAANTPTPPTNSAASAPVRVSAIAPAAAPVTSAQTAVPATANQVATASPAATGTPRILNPLPGRGVVPTHTPPSENVRAAGMASMIANRAHLKTPASEANAPAIQPAAPVQNTADTKQVASTKPATVPVGDDGIPTLNGNGEQALLDALNKNGISGAIGQQALMAYQKTMAMSPDAGNAAALTSAMTLH